MLTVRENVDLAPYTTFGVPATARYFAEIASVDDVKALVQHPAFSASPRFTLGGGSNVLFTRTFEGLIIKVNIPGVRATGSGPGWVSVEAGAGEVWHAFVLHCLAQGWGGIENLSLIPGTVGATPIQNIGAYGVEVGDVIEQVHAVEWQRGTVVTFDREACCFGYRDSFFKQAGRDKYLITQVVLRLTTQNHALNTSYESLEHALQGVDAKNLSIKTISDAVIRIRSEKLPDPSRLGNAGSFFKNPVVDQPVYQALLQRYPNIPGRKTSHQSVKIPAAWLIEQCGWKGRRVGNVGVHAQQPLVLVNFGGGDGASLYHLAMEIRSSVLEKFGIELEAEVIIL